MIDIREKISKLFDEYSHNVVYVRRDERFQCDCYVERSGEPSPDCNKCFGTGNHVTIEKVRTRRNITSVPETLIGINQLNPYGFIAPKAYVYYFEHELDPKDNDLILEVIWDVNGVPRHIKEKHLVSAAEPKYGHQGRIEFYQVYCRYEQKGDNDDKTLSQH